MRAAMKIRLLVGTAVVGLLAVMIFACLAPRLVRVPEYQIPWSELEGARIVQITDIHLGWATPDELVELAIKQTKQAKPDLVALTGDYLNHSLKYLPELRRFVSQLPRPCIAVIGNHDYWAGVDEIRTVLEAEGVLVLRNESTKVNINGKLLTVIGVDDSSTDHDDINEAFSDVEDPQNALVLTHSPGIAEKIAEVGGRLILAGHTHGFQFDCPGVTQPMASLVGMDYVAGWYTVGQSRLYVNPGIGSSVIQKRMGEQVQPQVAVIDLGVGGGTNNVQRCF
jgi:predicted MPP superfamily phosphohydrolase